MGNERLRIAGIGVLILMTGKAWSSSPGTSGGAVLNIPVGARAIGMGEAYTAQADDASSLYWNPAGMAFLNQSQASFMYNKFIEDLTYQNASVAVPFENGAMGASLSYLSYGQITGTDSDGNLAGDVSAYSGVGTIGGAWLGNNWAAGVNLKGVQESLADTKATGFAADVGTSLVYPNEVMGGTLRAAAVVRNMGSGLKLIDQNDPFPLQWRLGVAAVQMMNSKLNVSMDYGKERDTAGAIYAGTEYWVLPFVALRAGYAGSDAEGNGIRAGLGLKFRDLSFDYAYSSYGDLGYAHRYELSMRFGAIEPRLTPEERRLLHRAKVAMAQGRYGEATELFDALIQMEPHYRPVRRLVKVAMRGYESQERDQSRPFSAMLPASKPVQHDDGVEVTELETLLNMNDEKVAEKGGRRAMEAKP